MKTIWKYDLELTDSQEISLPTGARICHVGLDPTGEPCLWAMVDTDQPPRQVRIAIVGTGHPISGSWDDYVGSFVSFPFVWHMFSEGKEGRAMTRPLEICSACGMATGHVGYGEDSIGYVDGMIGPLCDECNTRLVLEVEAESDLRAKVERLRSALTSIRDRGTGSRGAAVVTSMGTLRKIAEQALSADEP